MGHAAADAERIEHAGEELHGDEKRILPAMREGGGRKGGRHQRIHQHHALDSVRVQHGGTHGDLCAQAVPNKHGLLNAGVVQHPHQVGRMNLKRRLFAGLARTVSPQVKANDPPAFAQRRLLRKLLPAARIGAHAVNEHDRARTRAAPA